MPGEAAAFFLVETLASVESRGAAIPATIEASATAIEPVTIEADGVCDATGLTSALRSTLTALPDGGERIGLVVGDLNGEPYRSEEYAYMVARAFGGDRAPFRLWHPADAIGDTGAASAALSIAVAARALHRGYARTDEALVFASSEGGLRGTALLRKHTPKPRGL
jgi:3-oxoacyl-[acyl-carrier-protein] synthase-1